MSDTRRIALITGAGSGIGRVTALALSDAGFSLAAGWQARTALA